LPVVPHHQPAHVAVVGAGAAGLVAAWRAAQRGARVTLLEANPKLGVKLRISGGGKCNVTHAGSVGALLAAFPREQARFLRPALHRFTNDALVGLLHDEGVPTYVRENGRVFPLDRPGSALAVVAALERLVRRAGVEVRTQARVTGLAGAPPRLQALRLGDASLAADAFVLACGGASYPETGTRGEWLDLLGALGVPTRAWFPALAPIPLAQARPEWMGVALRGGTLALHAGAAGRRLATFAGDVLFTRIGITGPAALELSQASERARLDGRAWLTYASTALTPEALDAALVDEQRANPQLKAVTWLQRQLPERLCAPLLGAAGLDSEQRLKDLKRPARHALVALVSALPLGVPGPVPLARGEVAAGGVGLAAVDAHSMAVRGFDNLFVCGELLDVDGPVGGYNLQAAFSTGFVAGDSVPIHVAEARSGPAL
jgi:hypothetical protein